MALITNRDSIDMAPTLMARRIVRAVERSIPTRTEVRILSRQLLKRHAICGLKPVASSEEILEGYYRCLIADTLVRRHRLSPTALPCSVNSSHRAVRRVCLAPGRHDHADLGDHEWREGWALIQRRSPEVNVRVAGRRSPKRADLYVVAARQVVSLEFKYVGPSGLRDVQACAEQVRRHAKCHAVAILVLYSGNGSVVPKPVIRELLRLTGEQNVSVASLAGPAIPIARGAA